MAHQTGEFSIRPVSIERLDAPRSNKTELVLSGGARSVTGAVDDGRVIDLFSQLVEFQTAEDWELVVQDEFGYFKGSCKSIPLNPVIPGIEYIRLC